MAKLIILSIALCFASVCLAIDEVDNIYGNTYVEPNVEPKNEDVMKIYINEVDVTLEEYILFRTFELLLANYHDYSKTAKQLALNLNETYGKGWHVMTGVNVDFSAAYLPHAANGLFYFSYKQYHFYVLKAQTAVNANNCTQLMQAEQLRDKVISARSVAPRVLNSHSSNATIEEFIYNAIKEELQLAETCDFNVTIKPGDYDFLNFGYNKCLERIADNLWYRMYYYNTNVSWYVGVGVSQFRGTEFLQAKLFYLWFTLGDMHVEIIGSNLAN